LPLSLGAKKRATSDWVVPYCSECLAHASRFALAAKVRRRGHCACAVVLAGGMVAILVFWLFAVKFLEERLGPGLANGATLAVGGAVVFLVYQFAKEVLERARSEVARVVERAENMLGGSCGNRQFAVAYRGGDGALHTFELYNQKFAAAFRRMNAGQAN
jgi:hypothetical protein